MDFYETTIITTDIEATTKITTEPNRTKLLHLFFYFKDFDLKHWQSLSEWMPFKIWKGVFSWNCEANSSH